MNNISEENKYLLAWFNIQGIGPRQLLKIRDRYGSFKFVWAKQSSSHAAFNNLFKTTYKQRASLDIERLWRLHSKSNPNILSLADPHYPDQLIHSHPEPILYYRGNLSLLQNKILVAVVGSRQLDNYNASSLKIIFKDLVNSPLVIVSGLAYGLDALAHELALDYNLPTIAVLGSPITNQEIYPRQNYGLAQKILEKKGLLLSPFATGTPMSKNNFPYRNQIISGLSQACLVVSAAAKSGALITARLALEANREVMAIPGNINQALSQGSNKLIQQGAHLISSGQDILNILKIPNSQTTPDSYKNATAQEKIVIEILKLRPHTFDELLLQTPDNRQQLLITLSQMELKNWLEKSAGNLLRLK